jgi:hypothetical protein
MKKWIICFWFWVGWTTCTYDDELGYEYII